MVEIASRLASDFSNLAVAGGKVGIDMSHSRWGSSTHSKRAIRQPFDPNELTVQTTESGRHQQSHLPYPRHPWPGFQNIAVHACNRFQRGESPMHDQA